MIFHRKLASENKEQKKKQTTNPILEVLFGKGIEEKYDKRTSRLLALRMGEFLAQEADREKVVNAINKSLEKLSQKDEKYAKLVLSELRDLYSDIDRKHRFEIKA